MAKTGFEEDGLAADKVKSVLGTVAGSRCKQIPPAPQKIDNFRKKVVDFWK